MASEISFEVTRALKNALKAKGKTYREVAEHIGVSEQTIKRLFREKDCSISRIHEICLAIGISIYDLFSFAQYQTETRPGYHASRNYFWPNTPRIFPSYIF